MSRISGARKIKSMGGRDFETNIPASKIMRALLFLLFRYEDMKLEKTNLRIFHQYSMYMIFLSLSTFLKKYRHEKNATLKFKNKHLPTLSVRRIETIY